MLIVISINLSAQEEKRDSIFNPFGESVKAYGDFMIDMDLMMLKPVELHKTALQKIDQTKDYSSLFVLSPDVTYSQGNSNIFSSTFSQWGTSTGGQHMQMGSFKLKNGMRINTYGDYNAQGYRVGNPAALPWERNNFRGAFEFKSANGSFGIKVEVQQGRNSPF